MKKVSNKNKMKAFTLAEENCQFAHSVRKFGKVEDAQYNYKAFTLAEVLITLAIIGVVSALVIPSVLKNYNDKKYNTARLKALKTFGEAGKMASINGEINGQPSARAFVENVLSKYLKIVKVCDTAEECNFPSQIQPLNPSADRLISDNIKTWKNLYYYNYSKNLTDLTDANLSSYITTADGFSAKIFYNPNCIRNVHDNPGNISQCTSKDCWNYLIDDTCMNVIYDMNGQKRPNSTGEDIGYVTVFWSGIKATVSAPGLITYNVNMEIFNQGKKTFTEAIALCESYKINQNAFYLPSMDEIGSITINNALSCRPFGHFWSSSKSLNGGNSILQMGSNGERYITSTVPRNTYSVWCVRR